MRKIHNFPMFQEKNLNNIYKYKMESYLRNVLTSLYNDLCKLSHQMTRANNLTELSLRRRYLRTLDNYIEVSNLLLDNMNKMREKVSTDIKYLEESNKPT